MSSTRRWTGSNAATLVPVDRPEERAAAEIVDYLCEHFDRVGAVQRLVDRGSFARCWAFYVVHRGRATAVGDYTSAFLAAHGQPRVLAEHLRAVAEARIGGFP
jgi:hypothetical protein